MKFILKKDSHGAGIVVTRTQRIMGHTITTAKTIRKSTTHGSTGKANNKLRILDRNY